MYGSQKKHPWTYLLIQIINSADPDVTVDANSNNFSFVVDDLLNAALVTLLLVLAGDLHLAESSVPQQHVSPLAAREDLAARQFRVPVYIRYLLLAELAEVALQLEAGERVRHLPEPASRNAVETNSSHAAGYGNIMPVYF